ncbi:AMP-binding protein [Facilibium subflavum]|uniref:AMP-binding protein n=1 Tax=Facilibium subflavum TaxID=2219058 RepID=UPI0013C32D4D|nr:AMP-binding protein [Facilibium subflavum]
MQTIDKDIQSYLHQEKQILLDNILSSKLPAIGKWVFICQKILTPKIPFFIHKKLYETCYHNQVHRPIWQPKADCLQTTYLGRLMSEFGFYSVKDFHQFSCKHREQFWQKAIEDLGLPFLNPETKVLSFSDHENTPRWLPSATFNIAQCALLAAKEKTAIIFSDERQKIATWSYQELDRLSNKIANILKQQKIKPGTRIAIIMPMHAYAVAIYLGIIKAGCTVVSIADSFAENEIKKRLKISNTQLVFTQDAIHRGEKTLPLCKKILATGFEHIICLFTTKTNLIEHNALNLEKLLSTANDVFSPVAQPSNAIINILFSSGTTGDPKAIPWNQTTALKAASDAKIYMDTNEKDIWAWPSNLGWMMGPWLVFAALLNKATIALFDGMPTSQGFIKFIAQSKTNKLGVVPTLVKSWKNNHLIDNINWQHIDLFASTGEASNPQDMLWLSSQAGYKPVIEYCGGTEIGGAYISTTLLQDNVPSTFSTICFGIDAVLLAQDGHVIESTPATGEIALIPPALGLSQSLLNADHHKVYYEGMPTYKGQRLRRHGDQIHRLENGYYLSLGRIDDTMNLGGIKVSSAEIERVVNNIKAVDESAAIAHEEETGISQLVLFIVLQEKIPDIDKLQADIQQAIKTKLNPLFKINQLIIVDKLPKTASNKIVRRELKKHLQQKESQLQ